MNASAPLAPQLSRRAESLGTENAFVVLAEVNALIRQGRDIVSFCIGQPDFPTPANIQDGRHSSLDTTQIDVVIVAQPVAGPCQLQQLQRPLSLGRVESV